MSTTLSQRIGILFALSIFLASPLRAQSHLDHNPDMATAWHEFAMFGKKKIFLSHLSEFHSIHNYEVIIEVTLDEASREKYLTTDGVRFRLSPTDPHKTEGSVQDRLQDWKLPDYMHEGVKFNGDIQLGQKLVASNASITVTRVVHFSGFDDKDARPKELNYVLFGAPGEWYVAHVMKHFPDFEQILAVEATVNGQPLTDVAASVTLAGPKYAVVGPTFAIPETSSEPEEYLEGGEKKYRFHPLDAGQTVKALGNHSLLQWKITSAVTKAYVVPREY